MHIARDYPEVMEYIRVLVNGDEFMCNKELTILFVDKYKCLLAENEQLKSQKEKIECQKKTQSKLSKKKKQVVKRLS